MSVSTTLLILSTLAASAAPPAQDAKPFGTIFRSDVDAATAAIRQGTTDRAGFGPARSTAKMLTAMGHCHRFYSLSDGPLVRGAIKHLFTLRHADGSFGEPGADEARRIETTQWVVDALDVLDPVEHASEVELGRKWLAAHTAERETPWQRMLASILDRYARGDGDPRTIGEPVVADLRAAVAEQRWPQAIDALTMVVACQAAARKIDRGDPVVGDAGTTWSEAQQQGFAFLLSQQDAGEFFVQTEAGKFPDTGLTAIGLAALQTKPAAERSDAEQAVIDEGLKKIAATQNDDGSFAERNSNYTTCAAVLALAMAQRKEFEPALRRAQEYILTIQNVEDRGYARSDRDYGSIGYGGDQRGDLSNLQFAVEALRASGLKQDHEAFAKALVFLQRSQNLRAVNDFAGRVRDGEEWIEVTSGDDGGAIYYPGNSPAGYIDLPDGKKIPRSYGSMTYALLKTYTLAGVKTDDPRVKAAVDWIEANWTLDVNPGSDPKLPEKTKFQGLYYYYMVLAQALDASGIDTLELPTGDVHWRELLVEHLESIQNEDGSWLNERNSRWWEDQRTICTVYSLLAIHRAS